MPLLHHRISFDLVTQIADFNFSDPYSTITNTPHFLITNTPSHFLSYNNHHRLRISTRLTLTVLLLIHYHTLSSLTHPHFLSFSHTTIPTTDCWFQLVWPLCSRLLRRGKTTDRHGQTHTQPGVQRPVHVSCVRGITSHTDCETRGNGHLSHHTHPY